MDEDELDRRLRDAFEARVTAAVPEQRPVPPLDLRPAAARSRRHKVLRWGAPLAAAAAVAAIVVGATTLGHSSGPHRPTPVAGGRSTLSVPSVPAPRGDPAHSPSNLPSRPAQSSPPPPSRSAVPRVGIRFNLQDGQQVGVGMPITATFSSHITDARALAADTRVTVNGQAVDAAWYFVHIAVPGGIIGHLRMRTYWPAHATVQVRLSVKGRSAGRGLAFAGSPSLTFHTGAANVALVDNATHQLTLTSDGRQVATYPVSLGYGQTPTLDGTKVIMGQGEQICMHGPGYDVCNVQYTQRLTYGGEYLNAAPWNRIDIERGIDSSNGCTNLRTPAARRLYQLLEPGDVFRYIDTGGPMMSIGAGYGDWNVPWSTWLTGGALPLK